MTSSIPAVDTRTAEGSALQAVLLDMDGTLVDTEGIWWDAEVSIFAELGHALAEEYRQVVVGGPMSRSAQFLIEATGAEIALAELTGLLNSRFTELIDGSVPMLPGAHRLLTELAAHGIPTALVSASHRRVMDRVLRSLGPAHFALTVAGDEVERTKPHPDPYLFAAAGLAAEPGRCVVIEDTDTGVRAAEAAGCRVVAVPSVVPIEPVAGRTVIGSLEEVDLDFLRTLVTAVH
ncbi:HAD family hydrolase [Streptomyces rapamycinicus]|uniref:Hydrolase n=2 Tax=Streptomyces rapamycinicus TaxID=1226757 RepID=A0A0A0NRY5_STRRN|nr:HAD family phosphatase [Streptomyces rapamycinicus]AGP59088.1 hydrolase [Streptomyces rapamycinicus NRRL 5491]MBB4786813.1 HAD superfamily hydrolase (TIGR01509 family) [Streptomyces rapamycinicus]RLV77729.1 hydrolase [Streptomyces rapamycinicus NRRL 5491]UTO66856.1 HAD family phosphatase [Streptomyces rapamycinicus]UTP34811.1 HAD family phosphatase [Streptomyces rapamycinicus NRRL 5491]